jgi:hypothetical protein
MRDDTGPIYSRSHVADRHQLVKGVSPLRCGTGGDIGRKQRTISSHSILVSLTGAYSVLHVLLVSFLTRRALHLPHVGTFHGLPRVRSGHVLEIDVHAY